MLETGTSGLMSGAGKRGGVSASVLAPGLDSTSGGSLQVRPFPSPTLSTPHLAVPSLQKAMPPYSRGGRLADKLPREEIRRSDHFYVAYAQICLRPDV